MISATEADAQPEGWCTRRRAGAIVLVLALLAGGSALFFSHVFFSRYSVNLDEVVYVSEARALADGKLTLPASQADFFQPYLTGIHGDRIVFKYQPAWPALIMVSDRVLGSARWLLGITAALTVGMCFLFGREIFDDRRIALLGTAIFAASPFFWLQSGTFLAYPFALLLDLTFGWLLLRGMRTGSRLSLALSGLALGASFFHRSADALAFAFPFGVYLLWTYRKEFRRIITTAAWVGLGALPFIALLLIVNQQLMGNALTLPFTVTDKLDKFGFGPRRTFTVAGGGPAPYFGVGDAFQTLGDNLLEVHRWIFGGLLSIGVAAWGLWKRKPEARDGLLLGLVFVFPVVYFFWWGNWNNTELFGTYQLLGPFYYFPAVVPLALLAARGLLLIRWRTATIALATIALVAVTGVGILRAVQRNGDVASDRRKELAKTAKVPDRNALLFLPDNRIGGDLPTLTNNPDLSNSVLYATDQDERSLALALRYPDRRDFRLIEQLGAGKNLFKSKRKRTLQELHLRRAPVITNELRIRNPGPHPYVIAYARAGEPAPDPGARRRVQARLALPHQLGVRSTRRAHHADARHHHSHAADAAAPKPDRGGCVLGHADDHSRRDLLLPVAVRRARRQPRT